MIDEEYTGQAEYVPPTDDEYVAPESQPEYTQEENDG